MVVVNQYSRVYVDSGDGWYEYETHDVGWNAVIYENGRFVAVGRESGG